MGFCVYMCIHKEDWRLKSFRVVLQWDYSLQRPECPLFQAEISFKLSFAAKHAHGPLLSWLRIFLFVFSYLILTEKPNDADFKSPSRDLWFLLLFLHSDKACTSEIFFIWTWKSYVYFLLFLLLIMSFPEALITHFDRCKCNLH